MRAVDTNVLVRLIVRDDTEQVEVAEKFIANGAWISCLVLAETVWVLDAVYGRSAKQLADAVALLLEHKDLVIQDADVVTASLAQFRKRPSLGFSDCLVVEIARRAGHTPLGTFDRNLAKLPETSRL